MPALTNIQSAVTTQISIALDEWVVGINGPRAPTFCAHAQFPDSEWGHFFRICSVSTALAATVGLATHYAPHILAPVLPDQHALEALTVFACFSVAYSLYSKLFGISISVRQSLFCFALTTTPWLPAYILLRSLGGNLGLVWFLLMPGLGFYVLYLCARAISIVSGAKMPKTIGSLLFAVALACAAIFTRIGVR